jgi:hypothetical protein
MSKNYDPKLKELSLRLRYLSFYEPKQDLAAQASQNKDRQACKEKLMNPNKPWHNVNRMGAAISMGYTVRFMVLGGMQIFGRSLDSVTACRFADMCVRRLDRFRSKKYPARYNFSEEQAIADEKNCPAARELLDQIEARVVTMQQENAPKMDRIGKLEAEVSGNLAQLCRRIEKLEKALGL